MSWINFLESKDQRLHREELDETQNKVKNTSLFSHTLLRGVAGSGKSVILKNRIVRIMNETDFTNILVLTFNRFMSGWINNFVPKNAVNRMNIDCRTFHKWSSETIDYDYKYDKIGKAVKAIENAKKVSHFTKYQAILVDEAQDFLDEWFIALLELIDKETNSLFFGNYSPLSLFKGNLCPANAI